MNGSSVGNTDTLKLELYYTNHNGSLDPKVATLADVGF